MAIVRENPRLTVDLGVVSEGPTFIIQSRGLGTYSRVSGFVSSMRNVRLVRCVNEKESTMSQIFSVFNHQANILRLGSFHFPNAHHISLVHLALLKEVARHDEPEER